MPITTPPIKIESVKRLNGEVLLYGDNFDEAYSHAQELSKEKDIRPVIRKMRESSS